MTPSLSNSGFLSILILAFTMLLLTSPAIAQVTSNIDIHARGNDGSEMMTLLVNGQALGTWNLPKSYNFSTYSITVTNQTTINSLKISSTSGLPWEDAIIIDKVVIDGVTYETEAPTTKGFTWDSIASCSEAYKEIEWISCANGWFEYEATHGVILANTSTNVGCNPDVPIIIFDTDMGPDIDDALALAMLHSYESNGKAKLAAVTVSRNSDIGARYCDLVNTFYLRPDIPVGKFFGSTVKDQSEYIVGQSVLSGLYPHDVHTTGSIKEGYKVMREVLAASSDKSVVIVQTGFSVNTAELLQSGPDAISPLTGYQLVQQKVTFLSLMGGRNNTTYPEFNIEIDLPSAQYVIANCPVDIIQSEFGLGYNIMYPLSSIYNDYNYIANHPVKQAYLTTDLSWHEDNGAYYNMRSWDLTSVIAAIDPISDYFQLGPRGDLVVQNDATTVFTNNPNGKVRSLGVAGAYSAAEKQKIINRMIDLSSQPPGLGNTCLSLQLKVCLEGARNASGDMNNNLQQLSLLPPGQPFNGAPWSYNGTEGAGWTAGDYPPNAVDWVLISLRTTPDPLTEFTKLAAVVLEDGTVTATQSIPSGSLASAYYIVIEHRNHLPAMSLTPVTTGNNTMTYDFTLNDGYEAGGGVGQKEFFGSWCLYAGSSDQSNPAGYEITGSDNILWQGANGTFQQYLATDYNMDGDVNGQDKVYWFANNGLFSAVPK